MKSVRVSVLLSLLTISCFTASTSVTLGDNLALPPRPNLINWITGPAKADLGNYGEIQIPDGYRFAASEDASTLLKSMNNPAPEALVGILAPNSGKYMVVFEFTGVGHVKEEDNDQFNPETILNSLRKKVDRQNGDIAKQGSASITSVGWEMEPEYDRAGHTMEWAIRAQTSEAKSINHVVRLFGREGVLDGIAVQSGQSAESIPLKQLMLGVSFKPGHTYADYRQGDKLSTKTLSQLITADEASEIQTNSQTKSHTMGFVLGASALLMIAGAGVLVWKRKLRSDKKAARQAIPRPIAVPRTNGSEAKLFPAGMPSREMQANGHAHVNGNGNGNAHVNGNGHHDKLNGHSKSRRRKTFDYQKYYSDLMFQVSDRAYEIDRPLPSRTISPSPTAEASVLDYNSHLSNGLIEGQKRLIEEQQRLIREQSKLIEEKTRLIQEKNSVLDKQSELFGNNLY